MTFWTSPRLNRKDGTNVEKFSISNSVTEVKTLLTTLASKKSIRILSMVDEELTAIKADRMKFKQILYNLMEMLSSLHPKVGTLLLMPELGKMKQKLLSKIQVLGYLKKRPIRSFSHLHSLRIRNSENRQGQDLGFLLSRNLWRCRQAESGLKASVEKVVNSFLPYLSTRIINQRTDFLSC